MLTLAPMQESVYSYTHRKIRAGGRGSLIDPPGLHACWLAANERLTATPLSHRGVEAEGVADANRVHPVPLPLKMQWLALGQDWLTQDANREYIEARLRAEAWWDDAYDANMDEAGAVTMTEVSAERHGVLREAYGIGQEYRNPEIQEFARLFNYLKKVRHRE